MQNNTSWAPVAIKLLKGPIYKTQEKNEIWNTLLSYRNAINEYFSTIGLVVFIDTIDNYAFLEQIDDNLERGMEDEYTTEENSYQSLPRLIKKTQLSYSASMLLVLLRNELDKAENNQSENEAIILRKSEIYGLYKSFSKDKADETKMIKNLDSTLRSLCKLTYLFCPSEKLNGTIIDDDTEFEISPIIKAKIDANFMKELLEKMNATINKNEEKQWEIFLATIILVID